MEDTLLKCLIPELIKVGVLLLLREKLLAPRLPEHIIETAAFAAPTQQTLLKGARLKQRGDGWLIDTEDAADWFDIVPALEERALRTNIISEGGGFVET